jgi:hypothetical protein
MKFLQGLGDDFYSDDGLYHGGIVPLGTPLAPLKTTAELLKQAQMRTQPTTTKIPVIDASRTLVISVAQKVNSEKNYAGATITPFELKEWLVALSRARQIPQNVLAKDATPLLAFIEVLRYAAFKGVISSSQEKELRNKSGFFDGGPVPPLTFQQWLALVDQALALPTVIQVAPIPAGNQGASQQPTDATSPSDQDASESESGGMSMGMTIGIGIGFAALIGAGFFLLRKKK